MNKVQRVISKYEKKVTYFVIWLIWALLSLLFLTNLSHKHLHLAKSR